MLTVSKRFAQYLVFVLLTGAGVGTSGALFAQEPEEEPEAEAPASAAEDADATDKSDSNDTNDASDNNDSDDSNDAGDADSDDEYADVEQPADYADDAIPTDTQLDPTRISWDVVDFEDDGDNQEDVEEAPHPGIREPEDMPTVRPHQRKAPQVQGRRGRFPALGGRPADSRQGRAVAGGNLRPLRSGAISGEVPRRQGAVAVAALLRRFSHCARLGADRGPLYRSGHGERGLSRSPRRRGHLQRQRHDVQDRSHRAARQL